MYSTSITAAKKMNDLSFTLCVCVYLWCAKGAMKVQIPCCLYNYYNKAKKVPINFLVVFATVSCAKQCQNCSTLPHGYQCWWQCKRKESLQVCSSSLEVFQVVSLVQYQNYMPEYVFICLKLFLELIKCTKIKRKIIKKTPTY